MGLCSSMPLASDFVINSTFGVFQAIIVPIMTLDDGNSTATIANGYLKGSMILNLMQQHPLLIHLLGAERIFIYKYETDSDTARYRQACFVGIGNAMKNLVTVCSLMDLAEKNTLVAPIAFCKGDNFLKKKTKFTAPCGGIDVKMGSDEASHIFVLCCATLRCSPRGEVPRMQSLIR
ncbi:unnamed protein product [Polarella glacialis]|uniref:Uncharacterized protein n=1 Tax=Polarella glacialis TaxID=89957 RepID=A0A813E0U9_POLGL|nr:unnamed protein product [Polarella glacialis]CAE8698699.1 unnamed protein product [Polarella glacialis]